MTVNSNEAPEGYIAVKGSDCTKCAFIDDEITCFSTECFPSDRSDNSFVIFIKKE